METEVVITRQRRLESKVRQLGWKLEAAIQRELSLRGTDKHEAARAETIAIDALYQKAARRAGNNGYPAS